MEKNALKVSSYSNSYNEKEIKKKEGKLLSLPIYYSNIENTQYTKMNQNEALYSYLNTGSLDLRVQHSATPPTRILLIVRFSKFLLILKIQEN